MKILQIIHKPQNRGAETFACQLSNHLLNLGHEVKIVAVFEGDSQLSFSRQIMNLNASAPNRFLDYPAWKRLAKIIDNFKPDVVQANAGDTLKYAVFSKLVFRWKAPLISRNASEIGRYLHSAYQKIFNRFLYSRVDHVISVSRASEKDILKHFPFIEGKTEVIPVGLEKVDFITPAILKPSGKFHMVHVGGFSFEKDHKALLRIYKNVLKEEPNTHLHLVGDGPLKKEIEAIVMEKGLQESVNFYGFVNNPLSFIKAANVVVLPSMIEGLPGVLLEAMYCKIPVVAYNVGGISEIVSDRTGTIIERNDEEGFANAVLKNLRETNKAQVKNAYNMVLNEFLNEQLARKFENSYKGQVKNGSFSK